MSGLVGLCYLDGRPVEPADLRAMLNSIAHRGPDGEDIWVGGSVGLGHRRLWITPESHGERLPRVDEGAGLVIIADTRLDNRHDLISVCGLTDRPPSQVPDSELILAAYQRWGEECPQRLQGAFSFAIWDQRRRALFCARDHFGLKPFCYYYQEGGLFACASEIKALLQLGGVPKRLNELQVGYHLLGRVDAVGSFYQGIYRLPAAHRLTVEDGRVILRKYWGLDPEREVRLACQEEYAEAFLELFARAVRRCLRSVHPVGVALSGGLDSSSVACMGRELNKSRGASPLLGFSIVYDDLVECDERPYIHSVIEGGGIEPHYLTADEISPLADWVKLVWHLEEPHPGPNIAHVWMVDKSACQQGVRVLLDGVDGDWVVSHGIGWLAELAAKGRWGALIQEAAKVGGRAGVSPARVLWQRAVAPLIPWPVRHLARRLRSGHHTVAASQSVVSPGFARRVGLEEKVSVAEEATGKAARTARTQQFDALTSDFVPYYMEVLDKIAAAFGIEARHPFFDLHLVEFCLALPGDQKLRNGWTRFILRYALEGVLPPQVQWRPWKTDARAVLRRNLWVYERNRIETFMREGVGVVEPYVTVSRLGAAYNRYRERRTSRDALIVWRVLTLALWLEQTGLRP